MKLKNDGSMDIDIHNNDDFVAMQTADSQVHALINSITSELSFQRNQPVRKVWEVTDRLIALGNEISVRAASLKAHLEEHDSDYIDESQVPQGEQLTEYNEREDLL